MRSRVIRLPVGILALIGSGMVVLVREYLPGGRLLDAVFWIALAAATVSCAFSLYYYVVRSFHGHVYRHLPFPSELKRYHADLLAHYEALGRPLVADLEFPNYLTSLLVEATDRNTASNVNRGGFLNKTNRAIIVTLLAGIVAAIAYSIGERTRISAQTGQELMGSQPQPSSVPPVVPPKPVPPQNFDERTGVKAPRPAR
jgi:hypothetical protein